MTDRAAKTKRFGQGRIAARFGNAVRRRCAENNCRLGLRGLTGYTILKGETVVTNKKICDCIILHDGPVPHVVLVELKRGLVRARPVEEKFENALEWLSNAWEDIGGGNYKVIMLLLHGRHISKSDSYVLRSRMFTLRGRTHQLQVRPCGTQLVDLYKRATLS